jgi:SAM-dependent methyltransferase
MQRTNLFDQKPKTMLHIAPEAMFAPRFRRIPNLRYITADLLRHNVTERIDLTTIPHPDNTFDISYCSHVLEHIPDDRQAMRELCRVLKPGGWALIDVPVTVDVTVEDPSITDPQERERLFGQHDHVRRYGLDVIERLQQAGFQVQKILPTDLVSREKLEYMGLIMRSFFICTK